MASIGLGHFLPGGQLLPAGIKGINETYRGMIEVDQLRIPAYVKLLHPYEVFNEALGSILCQIAGLPTPPSYLVLVDGADYPESKTLIQWGVPQVLAFGSHAMPMQSMSRHASFSTANAIRELISKWKEWPDVLVFDQWIANPDRHPGNLLIGGPGEVHLIDHGRSFCGKDCTPEKLQASAAIETIRLWKEFLEGFVTLPERVEAARRANNAGATFLTVDANNAIALTNVQQLISTAHIQALVDFLCHRRVHASTIICGAMGIHSLPFGASQ